jgi:hypothetical protein
MLPEEMFASDEDRADFDRAEREHRWLTTPMTLHVRDSEMISPDGSIDDDTIARYEARFRERLPEKR